MHVHGVGILALTVDPKQKRQRMSREKILAATTWLESPLIQAKFVLLQMCHELPSDDFLSYLRQDASQVDPSVVCRIVNSALLVERTD